MKKLGLKTFITVLVVIGTMFVYSSAYCGGYSRPDNGDAPYGVAYQSSAAGTKIEGVCFIEFLDYTFADNKASKARVVLRLKMPGQLEVFYFDIQGEFPLLDNIDITQLSLIDSIKDTVVAAFGNVGQEITLKNVSDFVFVDLLDGVTPVIYRDQTDAAFCAPGEKKCEQEWTFEDCDNGMDDNEDGFVDRDDPLCSVIPTIAVMNVEFAMK
jgi:hypothetical protein